MGSLAGAPGTVPAAAGLHVPPSTDPALALACFSRRASGPRHAPGPASPFLASLGPSITNVYHFPPYSILRWKRRKDVPVPEGEDPKFDAQIVKEVLKTEVKQSTFLRNVGLESSRYNSGKASATVVAHVRDLKHKLERSELQAEVMQEEMTAIKMKAEEYEASRDKELELLRKKS
ncbi:hypothetical protein D1007_55551 [Hordeum vulgare]|nr:hypothetical protein D1007_55551 [Hordeum vulgare]